MVIWSCQIAFEYCSFQEEQSSTVGGQRMEGSRRPHSRAPVERHLWGSRDLSRPEVPTWPTSTQLSTWPMLPTTQSRFAIRFPIQSHDYDSNDLSVLISLSFHFKDLLVPTATCIRGATAFSQNCPDDNKKGFVFNNEFSSGWSNLDQTRVLVFHSWIAEFATVGSISGDRVTFQQPLSHAPVGEAPIVNYAQKFGD